MFFLFSFFMAGNAFKEMLTSIRNAILVKSAGVEVKKSKMTEALSAIIYKEGLIDLVSTSSSSSKNNAPASHLFISLKYRGRERISVVTNLQLVSRATLRFYTSYSEIPQIFGGLGLVILSTSRGMIIDREARSRKLGGEVLCSIW
jgi:small subunit ribosomal protein S8